VELLNASRSTYGAIIECNPSSVGRGGVKGEANHIGVEVVIEVSVNVAGLERWQEHRAAASKTS
jgi:hypothetical protein